MQGVCIKTLGKGWIGEIIGSSRNKGVIALGLNNEKDLGPKDMKAWSQNLGHEKLDTTYNSYGNLDPNAQRRAMLKIGEAPKANGGMAAIQAMIDEALARRIG